MCVHGVRMCVRVVCVCLCVMYVYLHDDYAVLSGSGNNYMHVCSCCMQRRLDMVLYIIKEFLELENKCLHLVTV